MGKRRRQGGFEQEPSGIAGRLARLFLALVVTLVAVESLSLGWIKLQRGVIYYYARGSETSASSAVTAASPDVFHPYFGYAQRPGGAGKGSAANNAGFPIAPSLAEVEPTCCDLPRPRRDNELLVGVFGGTTARDFALQAQTTPMLGRALQQIASYADRPVRVLNFALADFHQPQPLIALAYAQSLGQALDVVLEIDGPGELIAAERHARLGVEPSFPLDARWSAAGRDLENRGGAAGAEAGLARYYRVAATRWTGEAQRCWLASCHLAKQVLAKLSAWRADRLARGEATLAAGASRFPSAPLSTSGDPILRAADRWRDSSLAMAGLAKQGGALFVQVLQPAPWVQPSVDAAPSTADQRDGATLELLRRAYPEIQSRASALKAAGIEFLDPTPRFADRTGLAEECCRLTAEGNGRLANAIAETIAAIHAEGRAAAKPR